MKNSFEDIFKNSEKSEKVKNKLIEAFHAENKSYVDKDLLNKILSLFINILQELYKEYKISYRDVPLIFNLLFNQRKIFEILVFRLITQLGFPSVINAHYREYEIDIITLINEIDGNGLGSRLIEVTTRKDLQNKLCTLKKLINKLRDDKLDNIKILVIIFKNAKPVYINKSKSLTNIYIISFDELIKDYPYKLISILLHPEIVEKAMTITTIPLLYLLPLYL